MYRDEIFLNIINIAYRIISRNIMDEIYEFFNVEIEKALMNSKMFRNDRIRNEMRITNIKKLAFELYPNIDESELSYHIDQRIDDDGIDAVEAQWKSESNDLSDH